METFVDYFPTDASGRDVYVYAAMKVAQERHGEISFIQGLEGLKNYKLNAEVPVKVKKGLAIMIGCTYKNRDDCSNWELDTVRMALKLRTEFKISGWITHCRELDTTKVLLDFLKKIRGKETGEYDALFFFYNGHGQADQIIAPNEGSYHDSELDLVSYYDVSEELAKFLSAEKPKIVVLDCCRNLVATQNPTFQPSLVNYLIGFSCAAGEVSTAPAAGTRGGYFSKRLYAQLARMCTAWSMVSQCEAGFRDEWY